LVCTLEKSRASAKANLRKRIADAEAEKERQAASRKKLHRRIKDQIIAGERNQSSSYQAAFPPSVVASAPQPATATDDAVAPDAETLAQQSVIVELPPCRISEADVATCRPNPGFTKEEIAFLRLFRFDLPARSYPLSPFIVAAGRIFRSQHILMPEAQVIAATIFDKAWLRYKYRESHPELKWQNEKEPEAHPTPMPRQGKKPLNEAQAKFVLDLFGGDDYSPGTKVNRTPEEIEQWKRHQTAIGEYVEQLDPELSREFAGKMHQEPDTSGETSHELAEQDLGGHESAEAKDFQNEQVNEFVALCAAMAQSNKYSKSKGAYIKNAPRKHWFARRRVAIRPGRNSNVTQRTNFKRIIREMPFERAKSKKDNSITIRVPRPTIRSPVVEPHRRLKKKSESGEGRRQSGAAVFSQHDVHCNDLRVDRQVRILTGRSGTSDD
jgi:hypothetical protein